MSEWDDEESVTGVIDRAQLEARAAIDRQRARLAELCRRYCED